MLEPAPSMLITKLSGDTTLVVVAVATSFTTVSVFASVTGVDSLEPPNIASKFSISDIITLLIGN